MADAFTNFMNEDVILPSEVAHLLLEGHGRCLRLGRIMVHGEVDALWPEFTCTAHLLKVIDGHGPGAIRSHGVVACPDHQVPDAAVPPRLHYTNLLANRLDCLR